MSRNGYMGREKQSGGAGGRGARAGGRGGGGGERVGVETFRIRSKKTKWGGGPCA